MKTLFIGKIAALVALLIGSVCAVALVAQTAAPEPLASAPGTQPASRPAPAAIRTSLWAGAVDGLQARVRLPTRIEQSMSLDASLEVQCDPDRLPAGISRLNTFLFPAFLRLTMEHVATHRQFELKPVDPTAGMPVMDSGEVYAALDGLPIAPLEVSFPLLGHSIDPGEYDCIVSYIASQKPPFFSGQISSAPLRITIDPETAKTRALIVPTRLRVQGSRIVFGKEDAEQITVPTRNGHVIGTRITCSDGDKQVSMSLAGGCWEPPTEGATVDQLTAQVPKKGRLTYTIEIFETPRPPQHMWAPDGKGFKTLWKKQFDVSIE